MQLARPFRGIVPPLVTPLLGPDLLDVEGLHRLVEHVLSGGVHGIFVLGTTGEGPNLSYRLRREVVDRVVRQVDGRVPVLVGVTDTAYQETMDMAAYAAKAGASAIVLAPPYYFSTSQQDLLRIVRDLALKSELPLFIYNMPSMVKVSFAPETVAEAALIPNVHGFKDSSGDIEYLKQVLALVEKYEDFSVLLGPEALLAEGMRLGVEGGVNGGANLHPRLYVDLYNASLAGDAAAIQRLQAELLALGEAIYEEGDAEYRYIRGLKCALSVLGICSGLPAWPYQPASDELRRSITAHLKSTTLLPS